MNYSQVVSVLVSSYTLVAISVERFFGIVYPFKLKMTRNKVLATVIFIWVASLISGLPTLLFCSIREIEREPENLKNEIIYQCFEQWPDTKAGPSYARYLYGLFLMASQYFLPVGIMIYTYSHIGFRVWRAKTPGEALKDRDKKIKDEKTRASNPSSAAILVCTLLIRLSNLTGCTCVLIS